MSKTAVVYWSGTGNTQAMAEAVASGATDAGADVTIYEVTAFDSGAIDDYDFIAFGCPSMGSEQLEESEFEPVFTACIPKLAEKKIALFGSYGWGDGEWMRNWEDTCREAGATLVCDSVICCEAPDEETLEACRMLGKALA